MVIKRSNNNSNKHILCIEKIHNQENEHYHSLLNLDVPKKYAKVYNQYLENKLSQKEFEEIKNHYSQLIHIKMLESIEMLVGLDFEYNRNLHLNKNWREWWIGFTGNDTENFFELIETSIKNNVEPSKLYQDKYKTLCKNEFIIVKLPLYVNLADHIFNEIIN